MLKALLALGLVFSVSGAAHAEPLHAIAMHGEPALPADFSHFPYVNPNVKKGGTIRYGVVGTFNNLNSFILKAKRTTARGMWDPEFGNLIVESLMTRSRDEPFTMYGLLAETVEWDEDRSFIQFNLNPKARWSDGQPVTPEDVIFTFELMRDKGRPPFSTRLDRVAKMEKVGEHSVKFTFNDKADREFPLLLAISPVLPKHATKVDGFDETTMEPPLGSGPYKVKSMIPGTRIVYERDPNYWGKDIPSKVGMDNYDTISVEYFLQENTLFEAFKKGVVDLYPDGSPAHWTRAYDFPAVARGDVKKESFQTQLPANMFAMVFNTRRSLFTDKRVREALTLAFDFEWVNRNLFENAYTRTQSFWQNSDLASVGHPASEREKELLGESIKSVEPDILDGTYRLPESDGSGRDRKILRKVVDLFAEAGYHIKGNAMVGPDGRPLAFEILTQNLDQEKIALSYKRSLEALGIKVSIRTAEDAQYQERSQRFDFDIIFRTYAASLSPGLEQVTRWGSRTRDIEGSDNFAGVANPDIDRMISIMLNARTAEGFKSAIRAHDRLLLSGHYVIPLYYLGEQRVARWTYIEHPETLPLFGVTLPAWWDARAQ